MTMKRFIITCIAFCMLLSGISAQVWLDYSLSGGVSTQWGIDIGQGLSSHGFNNQADSRLDLRLSLDPEIYSRNGTSWSAEINLTGLELQMGNNLGFSWEENVYTVDNYGLANQTPGPESTLNPDYAYTWIASGIAVSMPEISAKMLYNNRWYMSIAANPQFNYNWVDAGDEDLPDLVGVKGRHSGGVGFGVESDIFDWDIQVTSKESGTDNAWYNYAAGTHLTVKAEDILKLQAYYAYTQSYGDEEDLNMLDGSPYENEFDNEQNMGISLETDLGSRLELHAQFEAALNAGDPLILEGMVELPWMVKDHLILTISSSYAKDPDPVWGYILTSDRLTAELLGNFSMKFLLQDYNFKISNEIFTMLEAGLETAYKISISKGRYIKSGLDVGYNFNLLKETQSFLYTDPNGVDVLVSGDKDDRITCKAYLELLLVPNTLMEISYTSDQLMPRMNEQAFGYDKGEVSFSTEIRF